MPGKYAEESLPFGSVSKLVMQDINAYYNLDLYTPINFTIKISANNISTCLDIFDLDIFSAIFCQKKINQWSHLVPCSVLDIARSKKNSHQ